ncbi:Rv1733c family protein [Lentzea terrae]|uniref:Rv1733c family protein n=1 Tax=Lentzea terrae TaxID=2200761 RepID=UPI000DD2F4B2|nr:hypothetical protein [Lentzea terrae]
MDTKPLLRVLRQALPGRNELATAGDRLEGFVLVLAAVVALVAVPVAAAAGSEFYTRQSAQAVLEQQTRYRAKAVLTVDAPLVVGSAGPGGVVRSVPVPATWLAPDGATRHGTVRAQSEAKAGTTVPIWVKRNGDLTLAPLSAGGAAFNAIVVAVLFWTGAVGAMSLLHLVIRYAHKRSRMRRWAWEWERIARDWTAR